LLGNIAASVVRSHWSSSFLGLRLIEVEDYRHEVALAKLFPQSLQDFDPVLREPTEQQHALLADRVDGVAYLLVVQQ
jgi:hypothetical protein